MNSKQDKRVFCRIRRWSSWLMKLRYWRSPFFIVVAFCGIIINGTITHLLGSHVILGTGYPAQAKLQLQWDHSYYLRVHKSADQRKSLTGNGGRYCQWGPGNSTECFDTLIPNLCDTTTTMNFGARRVLIFGDSTMARLYWYLRDRLKMEPQQSTCQFHCQRKEGKRCSNRGLYGFDENIPARLREPQEGREGPVHFGLNNHGCSDCMGCKTSFHVCTETGRKDCNVTTENTWLYNGGFIDAEFARDVTLQTQYHNTSQENIAHYLKRDYNAPALLEVFGKPYCFVNAGIHDVLISGITIEVFVENVEWYLRLLQPECHRIAWISTTAPLTNNFTQTIQQTLEWNQAVLEMLTNRTDLPIPYIDVYQASLNFAHDDNIHMSEDWYSALSDFVGDLLDTCTGMA